MAEENVLTDWFVPAVNALALGSVYRPRRLPRPGYIRVTQDQPVTYDTIVARTQARYRVHLLDLRRLLGLSDVRAIRKALKVKPRDRVEKGALLAEVRRGLFRRRVYSPVRGRVLRLDGQGVLILLTRVEWFDLWAGFNGVVSDLFEPWGVTIATEGLYVEGVWGNGRIAAGDLRVLARQPRDLLQEENLDVEIRGQVLVTGWCNQPDLLPRLTDLGVQGLVLGTMDATCVSAAQSVPYPVLSLDGFGDAGLNPRALALLRERTGTVTVLAEPWDRTLATRPALLMDTPPSGQPVPAAPAEALRPGLTVRLLRAPYQGETGTVLSLQPYWNRLPNGIQAFGVDVRLRSGEHVFFPLANLEIVRESE
ncbi:MAG: hypothetical protein GXO36_00720 [Chloroflexi bacterium]|nr:hypothetical protein [Chloroflexota bacterium]